ncbi:MAG: hemolysin family protein, partial [bacterium]|nr:hemolysin family protein [bacterium]
MTLAAALPIGLMLLFLEAFFSGSEIAIVTASRARLRSLAQEQNQGAIEALKLLESPEWLMGTILVLHNTSFVLNVSLATLFTIGWIGPRYGELVSILVVIPFLVVFGEVVPKSFCQERADTLAPVLARVIWRARLVVYPVVWLLSLLIRTGLGAKAEKRGPFVTREELESLVQEPSEGDVRVFERKMISRILRFRDLDVKNVMVPLVDVSAISEEDTIAQLIDRIEADGHSRILVYREKIHNIVGVVHAREVLALSPDVQGAIKDIPRLIQPPYFVPRSKQADDLLIELKRTRLKLAVVVDEYGGCDGVVTMEDLVEEVVGDISDEYDVESGRLYQKIGEEGYLVDARMEGTEIRE